MPALLEICVVQDAWLIYSERGTLNMAEVWGIVEIKGNTLPTDREHFDIRIYIIKVIVSRL